MTSLRDWVEQVRADYSKLTPKAVVAAAREAGPDGCPCYERFRFDDDETAAELWRVNVAREIIREVRVVYKPATDRATEKSVRAYHSIPDTSGEDGWRYERVEDIAQDPLLRALILRDMERDWKLLKARYGHLQEFFVLIQGDIGDTAA